MPANVIEPGLPQTARPVGSLQGRFIYLRSIAADQAHRILIRRKRDRQEVNRGYDSGSWAQEQAARRWEKADTLAGYTERADVPGEMRATIGNRLWRIPAPSYYAMRRAKLAATMQRFAGEAERMVELGSGVGSIVFELVAGGWRKPILGLELSPPGRRVAETVAAHYGVEQVEFGHIDLLDLASEGYRRLAGATVYTHYCLEQLPSDPEAVFRNLVAAGVHRAILIEPTYELLGWAPLRDWASRTYVLRQDYQRSIVRAARQLEAEELITVVHTERLDFVSSHRNAGTLLVFDVRKPKTA